MADISLAKAGGPPNNTEEAISPPVKGPIETRATGSSGSRNRRPTTNIRPNVGRRDMKEYPLTDSDIETLGLTRGGATFFFSVGTLLLGLALNKFNEIDSWNKLIQILSTPLNAGALGAAIVCFGTGAYLWHRNGSAIRRIKSEVRFDS